MQRLVSGCGVEQLRRRVDDSRPAHSFQQNKEAEEQQQGVIIQRPERLGQRLQGAAAPAGAGGTEEAQPHADEPAAQGIEQMQHAARRLRQERRRDEQTYRQQEKRRGDVVLHLRFHRDMDGLALVPEQPEQHPQRGQRSQLHAPEDAGPTLHPEEIEEIHPRKAAQQNARGVPHQRCRAL